VAATNLLNPFLENEVDLIVGSDGGEWFNLERVNANPPLYFQALAEMCAGQRESEHKAKYRRSVWASKRDSIKAGKFVSMMGLPCWLENGEDRYIIRQDVVKVIKRIFSLYLSGMGCYSIVAKLNSEKVPVPTNGRKNATIWNSTFIQRLLKNKALIGYYSPRENPALEQAGVFPSILDEQTFYAANSKLQERTHYRGKTGEAVNLVGGLAKCADCGATIIKHFSHGTARLVCSNYRKGTCSAKGINYADFERGLLTFSIAVPELLKGVTSQVIEADATGELQGKIADAQKQIDKLYKMIVSDDNPSETLKAGLKTFEAKKLALQAELKAETVRVKGTPQLNDAYYETLKQLATDNLTDHSSRLKLREAIRGCVKFIEVDTPLKSARVVFHNYELFFDMTFHKDGFTVFDNEGRPMNLESAFLLMRGKKEGWITPDGKILESLNN
jgi:Recombinase/Recombinase zinc beta ribbon domain